MNRNYSERRHNFLVKGMRRIKEDRAEHGDSRVCECFAKEADKGRGRIFSRFANNPRVCSKPFCCGNPRKRGSWESGKYRLTIQERKAATTKDWD